MYALINNDGSIKVLPEGKPFTIDGVQHPYKRAADLAYPVVTNTTGEPSDFHNMTESLEFDEANEQVVRTIEYILKPSERVTEIAAAKKDRAKHNLEVMSENLRAQYVAEGDTKPSVYRRKEQEYEKYQKDSKGSFPFAEARAEVLGVTVEDVMVEWGNTIENFNGVMLTIEKAYDKAVESISTAPDDENIDETIESALGTFTSETEEVNKSK